MTKIQIAARAQFEALFQDEVEEQEEPRYITFYSDDMAWCFELSEQDGLAVLGCREWTVAARVAHLRGLGLRISIADLFKKLRTSPVSYCFVGDTVGDTTRCLRKFADWIVAEARKSDRVTITVSLAHDDTQLDEIEVTALLA